MPSAPAPSRSPAPPRTARGTQTRDKLKKAALRVLDREGYHRMRIVDVTREAGVAQGLFYHYFSDLKLLTLEVLEDFVRVADDFATIEKDVPKGDWYLRIYAHNLLVVRSYARHPGVMRCLMQMADEDAGFSTLLRDSFRERLMWLVNLLPRLFPEVTFRPQQGLMVVYAMAGGTEMLREYFIQRSEALRSAALSEEQLAELLSVMFYRALFLQHPSEQQLSYTRNLAAMAAKPKRRKEPVRSP
jgi:AcrR family transcriptional regulator